MKQRITAEQLNSLNDNQKNKLREWWEPKPWDVCWEGHFEVCIYNLSETTDAIYLTNCDNDGCNDVSFKRDLLPLLNIGQMIEFLDGPHMSCTFPGWHVDCGPTFVREELVDALWECVKTNL